ncbi:HlyD family secretion protein [Thiorhodococcus mannitoliphagus]|uniref:HlyD family secretion protein n=1 Tax=Thiorhodococcus mannitoliphagus TaxID=329406 RepID=A0A6P1E2I9_9GAMM|nr:HlyD family secretion protein [Thiorhodococcus mannitoliphagus]NEX23423.1 HlyD family secretion protein [Thiorhodococcus mannitoliphagus]
MNLRHLLIGLPVVALLAGGGWWYHDYASAHPATSDAYLGRHVVHIAAQVNGPIESVRVHNNQTVKAGDLLLTIDPAPFQLAVKQAEAQLQQAKESLAAADARVVAAQAQSSSAQANAEEAERHAQRIADLVAKGSASKDMGDSTEQAKLDAQGALNSARAELVAAKAARGALGDDNAAVKAAQAALDQARLDLEHTQIRAPADGVVGDFDLRPGSYVDTGSALFALVERQDVWVDANFKETDLPRIRPGQPATISVDLLPGKDFKGEVEGLSPASGAAFSLLPAENATGNWVKVTQRFAVRVRVLDPVPALRVGASAEVRVDTTAD